MNRGELIFRLLDSDKEVLDIGCASGYYTKLYSKRCKKIIGIDPNENLINIANERNPEIKFIRSGAEKLPFGKETFDIVIMSDVLEHVRDEEKSLNEVYRVLKRNGKLMITVPNKGLFDFLDVDNYSWYVRKFKRFYRLIHRLKGNDVPKVREGYYNKHKHYSLEDLKILLNKFKVVKYERRGILTGYLGNNLELFFRWIFNKERKFDKLKNFDYKFNFGRCSSSFLMVVKKN